MGITSSLWLIPVPFNGAKMDVHWTRVYKSHFESCPDAVSLAVCESFVSAVSLEKAFDFLIGQCAFNQFDLSRR